MKKTILSAILGLCLLVPGTAFAQPEHRPPHGEMSQERGKGMRDRMQKRRKHLGKLRNFMHFANDYYGTVKDPAMAVGLSALSIKDAYKRKGEPLKAVQIFEEALLKTKSRKIRNVLLYSIRQVHEENKNQDKVLEISRQILEENLK